MARRKKHQKQSIPAVPLKKKRAKLVSNVKDPEITIVSEVGTNILNEYAKYLSQGLGNGLRQEVVPELLPFESFLFLLMDKKNKVFKDALAKSPFAMSSPLTESPHTFLYRYDEYCKKLDKLVAVLREFPDKKMPGEKAEE
jgi:hypothetical protein